MRRILKKMGGERMREEMGGDLFLDRGLVWGWFDDVGKTLW